MTDEHRHLRAVDQPAHGAERAAVPRAGQDPEQSSRQSSGRRPRPQPGRAPRLMPALEPDQAGALARAKRASRFVGLFLPLVLVTAATAITLWWTPRMPDPMATHWSGGGPDDFGPPWSNAASAAGFGLGMIVVLQGAVFAQMRQGGAPVWSWVYRFMSAITLATVLLIEFAAVATAFVQLDLADATEAPGINGLMLVAGGISVAAGVGGFFVQPKLSIPAPAGDIGKPLQLGADERAVWVGRIRPSRVYVWVLLGTTLLMAAIAGLLFVEGQAIWMFHAGLVLLMLALFVTMSWYRVRADASGVEARSMVGWPVFRVPSDDIAGVAVRDISPLGEFGGWGLRWGSGRFGIVMRTGEGIVVTRRDGRIFALTVDDAEGAAALLATTTDDRPTKEAPRRRNE